MAYHCAMHGTAEMIFTGDELLRGDIVNGNQAYLGEALLELGLFATHALSVRDDQTGIVQAIRAAMKREPDVLLLSGGLGPTDDDLTREAVAEALHRPLEHHPELLEQIAARFAQLHMTMSPSNHKQALLPAGATALPFTGTAPGFWLKVGPVLLAAVPGVPRELRIMWEQELAPLIASHLGKTDTGVLVRRLRVAGIGEGTLADALKGIPWTAEGVEFGTRAGLEGITVILRSGPDERSRDAVARLETKIRDILGDKVFGEGNADMAQVVGDLLRRGGLTVATAESCTGGLVAKRLTDIAGSSDYFVGGAVTYSNRLKTRLLGVDPDLLATHGAVSEQVARAMAAGAAERLGADCAVATTGVAGPGGGTRDKPVGLVYIATGVLGTIEVRRFTMFRDRREIRERTAQTALDLLRHRLLPGSRGNHAT